MSLKMRDDQCSKTTRLNTIQKWLDRPEEDPPNDDGDDDDWTENKVDTRKEEADPHRARDGPDRRENQRQSRGDIRQNDRHHNQDGQTPEQYDCIGHNAPNAHENRG